jgi:trk system potassium uptake protein TrkA
MFVLIAGGGRTGAQLATFLVSQRHKVRLIEHRPDILAHIHRELPTEVVFHGNATDPDVLERAGAPEAQVLAACMRGDADNLALCFVARTRHRIPRTIATINNPRNAWLFDKRFHVDVAINQAEILASLVEQEMSLGAMMTLLKLSRGRYSLVEDRVQPTSPAVGLAIRDMALPPNAVIAAIIRQGEIVIPRGQVRFEAGDEVLAIVDTEAAEELARLLGHPVSAPVLGTPKP